jgi:hypothetical protein
VLGSGQSGRVRARVRLRDASVKLLPLEEELVELEVAHLGLR